MIGFWNYTTWLTYLSAFVSFTGLCILIISPANAPDYAMCCVLICGALDMFDGKVARTKKNRSDLEKDFGVQIDSLSDLIAFGVLPAAIAFKMFQSFINKWYFLFFAIVMFMYVLCALVRLGYFDALENARTKNENSVLKYYTGLPVTVSSFTLSLFYLIRFVTKMEVFKYIYIVLLAIISLLFVSKFKIAKAGNKVIIIVAIVSFIVLSTMVCFIFM